MSFKLAEYKEPDFTKKMFTDAPNASLVRAPHAKAAPKGFHATSIFPEYFKVDGKWHLAKDSRKDKSGGIQKHQGRRYDSHRQDGRRQRRYLCPR